MAKLHIRQNNNIFGEWFTCYKPRAKSEFLQIVGSGETPEQAYINYFNPLTFNEVPTPGIIRLQGLIS